jgi:hypothetical protein
MPRAGQTEINLRIVIENPVPGVMLSLQDKANKPVDPVTPGKSPVIFNFPVRIGPGPKFYGEYVRSEGPERRFVYVCIGQGAGQKGTPFSRRMKINIHDIPQALLDKAVKGKVIEGVVNGTGKDGTPACASVPLSKAWQARD